MRRRGFTLIEVLLALGLAALLLTILGMAIHVHLRVAESGRGKVEEAQLARALLHRIARDLRGAIRYQPVDLEKMAPTTTTSSQTSQTSAPQTPATPTTSDTAATTTTTGTTDSQLAPRLVGELTRLEIDTSFVPRLEEFPTLLAAAENSPDTDRPSEMKTVAYFLAEEEGGLFGSDPELSHGLVRRELDRSIARWAAEQGQLDQYQQDLEPIAPEVTGVEFRYYDGTDWQETWDSEEQGSWPLAVEITLRIARSPRRAGPLGSLDWQSELLAEPEEPAVYRLVVQLPAAASGSQSQSSESSESSESSQSTQSSQASQ